MQKCKYLDDLGLKQEKYGTNFVPDDDTRATRWAEQKETYGFDDRETWTLDWLFIEWIYTRVMMFTEVNNIDTTFHKISYKDKEITQEEGINKLLDLCKQCLLKGDEDDEYFDNLREICDIWKELLPHMWW